MDEEFGPAAMAIYTGELETLASLLAADPGLAIRQSSCGHPTLLQLIACEEPKIVDPVGAADLLISGGAPTTSALAAAAGCNGFKVLDLMLDRGVDINAGENWTPLDEALYWAHDAMAAVLVERGASIRALSTAAGLGDVEATLGFFDGDQLRPSAGPIGSPFPDTIGDLGNDNQAIIDHAFVMAVNNGHRGSAVALLAAGAEVNSFPPGYHWTGTALHAAAWRGNVELAAWLLSEGADPSLRDGLATSDALGWARHHEHPDLVELFESC